ncbi:MAG: hypothetical protein KYQ20_00865 [Candidatus Nealsonbacteria bacterium]|nr:hypothetical protein [Candidatus Nealsonbacteria bacterium]
MLYKKINIRKIKKSKVLLGLPLALVSLEIYFGTLFGYFITKFLSGKQTGCPGKIKSIAFNVGDYRLHLHHWLLGLMVLIFALWHQFLPFPHFSFGFLGGLIFQGIFSYSDWRRVLIKKDKNKKIN